MLAFAIINFVDNTERNMNNYTKFILIILVLVGGLRWSVGFDWDQYLDHFNHSHFYNIFSYDRYGDGREVLEPGFVFINAIVNTLFGEFWIYNLIICTFIQYSYLRFCKKLFPDYYLLCYAFIMMATSLWFPKRTELSIAILLWAYIYIKEQNLKKFIITVIIASSLHLQCLVVFPLYWIGRFKFPWYYYLVYYWFIYFSSSQMQDFVPTILESFKIDTGMFYIEEAVSKANFYAEKYVDNLDSVDIFVASLYTFIYLTVLVLFIDKERKRFPQKSEWKKFVFVEPNESYFWSNTILNVSMVYFTLYFTMYSSFRVLGRLADPMYPFVTLLYLYSIVLMLRSKGLLRTIAIVWFVLFALKDIRHIADSPYFKDANIPYKTILNNE